MNCSFCNNKCSVLHRARNIRGTTRVSKNFLCSNCIGFYMQILHSSLLRDSVEFHGPVANVESFCFGCKEGSTGGHFENHGRNQHTGPTNKCFTLIQMAWRNVVSFILYLLRINTNVSASSFSYDCGICYESLTEDDAYNPADLYGIECFETHVFCLKCLKKNASSSTRVPSCPQCRSAAHFFVPLGKGPLIWANYIADASIPRHVEFVELAYKL